MADPDMLFELNMKDADLRDALEEFFRLAGRAFVLDDAPDGHVSVRAADLGFRDAIALLLPAGYTAIEVGGIYHIKKM